MNNMRRAILSYTKFCSEVEKWLDANNLPTSGTAYDSEEVTKARLDAWEFGSENIFKEWVSDERYKELISCVHSGYSDEFLNPLGKHFQNTNQFENMKYLYERELKHKIRMMLASMKDAKEYDGKIDVEFILNIDTDAYETAIYSNYKKNRSYSGSIAVWRKKALDIINTLLKYFPTMDAPAEYVALMEDLQNKVYDISIKPKDLKSIK